jgi:hypothetical protein
MARVHRLSVAAVLSTMIAWSVAHADPPLPANAYAAEVDRPIKALSAEQIDGLRKGEGMGLARSAELNGYPGPRHVLDLAEPLRLSPEQIQKTTAIFERMQRRAIELGERLIELERALDREFAERRIDVKQLHERVGHIASLNGELRATHLAAHLQVTALLTADQLARYRQLRDYPPK